MSTWNDERHEAARKAAEGFISHGGHRIRNLTLSDALDEIERLRALTTITDDMVERAAETLATAMHATCETGWMSGRLSDYTIDGHYDMLTATRAALVAALNPKEEA